MIIMIGGAPCSGKTTLMKSILFELKEHCDALSPYGIQNIEPMPLFSCTEYKLLHSKILVMGRYPFGEVFGGTDKLSYGTIKKFRKFIETYSEEYKHILCEGDRFFRAIDLEWLIENYDARVYVLEVSLETEKQRHLERKDNQSEKWLKTRRTLISNLKSNFLLMEHLHIRNTQNTNVKKEILKDLDIY